MTEADRLTFGQGMLVLGETFNEPVSEVRIEAYFAALSDLDMVAVNLAIRGAVQSLRFFPKPIELRELIEGRASDQADAAWSEVLNQIRRVGYMGAPAFSDERTLRAVQDVWGSWRRMCETLPGEGPELIGWMKQFKATFETLQRRTDRAAALGMGDLAPNVRSFIQREQKRIGGKS